MVIKREKKSTVKVGYVGIGRRGIGMFKKLAKMRDVEITWVCDTDEEKLKLAAELLEERERPKANLTTDYKEMLADDELDAVIVMTSWQAHFQIALASLEAGKYTAIEVGCAYDLSDCYALVDAYERHGAPLMMLENCCYGRRELMALRMVREGLFGEVVHADGAYMHYLAPIDLFGDVPKGELTPNYYRQFDYYYRNCENYPTHALGPIAKILGINRGNKFLKLSSFASKGAALREYVKTHLPEDYPLDYAHFKQGDIITTIITCAGGETIRLTLDTTAPRPYYSRNFTIRGTKGCCIEEGRTSTFFLEGMEEGVFGNEEEFLEKYEHPLQVENAGIRGNEKTGHAGGIDWLVLRAFIEAVKAGTDTPIDAYDTASWLAVGVLSEQSIACGGAPVAFPDFTRGAWMRREPSPGGKYCLDYVVSDPDTPIVP